MTVCVCVCVSAKYIRFTYNIMIMNKCVHACVMVFGVRDCTSGVFLFLVFQMAVTMGYDGLWGIWAHDRHCHSEPTKIVKCIPYGHRDVSECWKILWMWNVWSIQSNTFVRMFLMYGGYCWLQLLPLLLRSTLLSKLHTFTCHNRQRQIHIVS